MNSPGSVFWSRFLTRSDLSHPSLLECQGCASSSQKIRSDSSVWTASVAAIDYSYVYYQQVMKLDGVAK
jgi:hypothetical protein